MKSYSHIRTTALLEQWLMSEGGLGLPDLDDRDTAEQREVREALLRTAKRRDPENYDMRIFCPITKKWMLEEMLTAAHIIPHATGDGNFGAIFGKNELHSTKNAILVSRSAATRFDRFLFSIVPWKVDLTSDSQVQAWLATRPRPYQFKAQWPEHGSMKERAFDDPDKKCFDDLDGSRIVFDEDQEPRAQYLRYHHLAALLAAQLRDGRGQQSPFQSESALNLYHRSQSPNGGSP
jgi:hypothetical protein